MKLVTLSFDDGFIRSNLEIARIYEKFGLSACLNVIARGHEPSFKAPDRWHVGYPKGDFGLWNELQARGHEVMPHGLRHANKQAMPTAKAKSMIQRCLDIFSRRLKGFRPSRAIFNFPYNRSTPELETWLAKRVRAFRSGGPVINPLPHARTFRISCGAYGPGNCERDLDGQLRELMKREEGWLVYNTHGLDKEGWGPIRADYLERLLGRLVHLKSVKVVSVTQALEWGSKHSR